MVNKRSTRFTSGYTQKEELEDMNAFLSSENHFLKKKNDDLAKALADFKIENQKQLQANFELHERCFNIDMERHKFRESLKTVSCDLQSCIEHFINLTENMTNALTKVNITIGSTNAINHFNSNHTLLQKNISNSQCKTAAIMPMIGGHTILSPKINLPRVTVKQLTDMMHNYVNENNTPDVMENDEIEFADNSLTETNDDIADHPENSSHQSINGRLETMQEGDEDEEEEEEDLGDEEEEEEDDDEDEDVTEAVISSPPILTGVFRDVKVYISPLNAQHIIKFKNKISSRKSNSRLNQSKNATLTPHNQSSHIMIFQNGEESSDAGADSSNITNQSKVSTSGNSKSRNFDNTLTNAGEYDPLEGPSHLLNNTETVIATPNETSTPYSPAYRSNILIANCGEARTPKRASKSIAKIKKKGSNITKRSKKRITESSMTKCSVKLQSISPGSLKSYVLTNSSRINFKDSTRDRPDSPTVLERSRRSSTRLSFERSTLDSTDTGSPPKGRQKRNRKQVLYHEPSLRKKLRRSK